MATIKLHPNKLQEYVQQYISAYCGNELRIVNPQRLKEYLREEADIDATEEDLVEALVALARDWTPKTSNIWELLVSFKDGGIFFTAKGE